MQKLDFGDQNELAGDLFFCLFSHQDKNGSHNSLQSNHMSSFMTTTGTGRMNDTDDSRLHPALIFGINSSVETPFEMNNKERSKRPWALGMCMHE